MKFVTNLYKNANNALITSGIVKNKEVLHHTYKGYIAGLGALIIQMDLIPAFAVYCNKNKENSDSSGDRSLVAHAIALTLKDKYHKDSATDFLQYCIEQSSDLYALQKIKQDVIHAATALKIMLRTYKIPANT